MSKSSLHKLADEAFSSKERVLKIQFNIPDNLPPFRTDVFVSNGIRRQKISSIKSTPDKNACIFNAYKKAFEAVEVFKWYEGLRITINGESVERARYKKLGYSH